MLGLDLALSPMGLRLLGPMEQSGREASMLGKRFSAQFLEYLHVMQYMKPISNLVY